MPDPTIEAPEKEIHERTEEEMPVRRPYDPARSAINSELAYHPFKESEFEQGAGYCDSCGGGPDAAIHQKPVDHLERIANALERIADLLQDCTVSYDHGQLAIRVDK